MAKINFFDVPLHLLNGLGHACGTFFSSAFRISGGEALKRAVVQHLGLHIERQCRSEAWRSRILRFAWRSYILYTHI